MARGTYAFTFLAAVLAAAPAQALQLTNRDATDQKIVVTEKTGTQELLLKPSQMLDGVCNSGCTMKMSDGEEYEFDGNEVVSIEEGLMFLDEPTDTGAPDSGILDPGNADAGTAEPDGAEKKN